MPKPKKLKPREPRIRLTKNIVINGSVRAEGLDLSESGMYIYTKAGFTPGTIINIRFMLNSKHLGVSAEVLHAQHGVGLGVRFTGVEREALEEIKGFISNLADKIKNTEKTGE